MIRIAVGAIAAAITLGAVGCGKATAPRDLLIVTLDTTRADRLGCYGGRSDVSASLDAFAANAVLFEAASAPAPVTLPSHATMFTGLNPYRHQLRYNALRALDPATTTLAEILKEQRFATGAIVASFAVARRFGLDQGFDRYDDAFLAPDGGMDTRSAERKAGEGVDLALNWWREHATDRRFLWLHLYDPHYEYDPPFPFSATFADRPYEGEIAYMDRELGRLLEHLRVTGELKTTLVVIAGDHGEGLFDHGERWHSELVYESTMHVPLIVSAPGRSKPRRIREPVGLVDLTPTVLDLLDLPVPPGLDGISLAGPIRGSDLPPRRAIYLEAMGGNINYGWSPLVGIRRGSLKYFQGARAELYDLANDARELNDLAPTTPDQAADLASELSPFTDLALGPSRDSEAERLDEEAMALLRSLGYVSGPGGADPSSNSGPHPPDMISIEANLTHAQDEIAAQRWTEAAKLLDHVLGKDPRNKFALFHRVGLFLRERRMPEATAAAEAFMRLYGDLPLAHDLLGSTLASAGRPLDGARAYEEGLKRFPGDARMRFRKILCLVDGGRAAAIEDDVRALEATSPDAMLTSVARAMREAARGRPDAALEELTTAVGRGFRDFTSVESSPLFSRVRALSGYHALRKSGVPPAAPS